MTRNSRLGLGLILMALVGEHLYGQAPAAPTARQVPSFQIDASWPRLPNNWVMGVVSAVAVDRHDHVWLLNRYRVGVPEDRQNRVAPPVLEFDANGTFVQAWGGQAQADGYEWPGQEHCLYVDEHDNVWIGGTAGRLAAIGGADAVGSDDMLLKLTSKGKLVMQIGHRGASTGADDTKNVHGPADVFVYEKTNEVFVGDEGNLRVIVFDASTGAFKRMWSAFGNKPLGIQPASSTRAAPAAADADDQGPPQFAAVHGVRVSNDGLVYVADRVNRRIQVFTVAGKYARQVFIDRRGAGTDVRGGGIAFSPDPEQRFMYVAENGQDHVIVFDRKTLEIVSRVGKKSPVAGSRTSVTVAAPGEFQGVHYLAVDSKGNLFTGEVDSGNRVERFLYKGLILQRTK